MKKTMNQKLILSLDAEIIKFAHSYSKKSGKSVSLIVEKYFRELKKPVTSVIPKEISDLRGVLKGINVPDKKDLRKIFHEDNIG